MRPGLQLFLLGAFRAKVDDCEIPASSWPRKSAKLLIKLLALAPGRKLHREQLIELLSPETEPDAGLNRLHKAIHLARYTLEPALERGTDSRFVLTAETQVQLGGVLEIDVDAFDSKAAAALESRATDSLEDALALYTGDLLEEDRYEDWASVHRERLRLTHQRLLGALCARYESAGDWRLTDISRTLLSAYPADEEAHRRLMRFYAANGQRHLALEQFRSCSDALSREMDAAPERATVELYEQILDGSLPALSSPPATQAAAPRGTSEPNRRRFFFGALGTVTAVAAGAAFWRFRGPTVSRPLSLAVLPLRAEPGSDRSIADGLTEELINSMSRMPGIKVMARATSFAFRDRTDPWQVGRELQVTYVVSGSVRHDPAQVSVSMELVDVSDGSRTWGRKYAVNHEDAPALQQLLNTELAAALRLVVGPEQIRDQARRWSKDARAYELYLAGRQYSKERTRPALERSIEIFEQAIRQDSEYALAYAGLADSYGLLGFRSGAPSEYFPKAREAARRALALDQSLAEAETSLAMVSALYEWNWPAAQAHFHRAIEINPGYSTAHHWLGVHLAAMGRFDEARAEFNKALALDPRSAIVVLNSGYPDLYQGNYRDALDTFVRARTLNPELPSAYEDLATVYERQKMPADAARAWVGWVRCDGWSALAARWEPLAASGDFNALLRQALPEFEKLARQGESPMLPALIAARLGEADCAFRWLDQAFEQRSPQLVYAAVDPKFEPIRPDPRFAILLRRIGLSPAR